MSGKSYTSGSMRSCAGSARLGAAAGHEVVLDALYERKRDKKSVRVLTVIIYVFCVSLAAIMLSLYYVFFWEPKDAQYAQRKVSNTVTPQISTTPMPTCFMPHTGRSHKQHASRYNPPFQFILLVQLLSLNYNRMPNLILPFRYILATYQSFKIFHLHNTYANEILFTINNM